MCIRDRPETASGEFPEAISVGMLPPLSSASRRVSGACYVVEKCLKLPGAAPCRPALNVYRQTYTRRCRPFATVCSN
eukprot:11953255-Alexandrium_andersonii.AAC.1